MPFSKLKAFWRKLAERTVSGLCRRIGSFARSTSATGAMKVEIHDPSAMPLVAAATRAAV